MAFFTLLFPLAFPLLLPLSLSGARTRLLSLHLAVLMTFFPLQTSPPVFLTLLPLGPWALPPGARPASQGFFYTRISFDTFVNWDTSPSLFSPLFSPLSSIFSASASRSRFYSLSFSHPPLPTRSSRVTSLSSSSPSSSHAVCCAISFSG